jgi:hypothetical protein
MKENNQLRYSSQDAFFYNENKLKFTLNWELPIITFIFGFIELIFSYNI